MTPKFDMSFYAMDKQSRYAGVSFYDNGSFAICNANGAQTFKMDAMYPGRATD